MGSLSMERKSILEGMLDYVRTLRASRNVKLAAAATELEYELGVRLGTIELTEAAPAATKQEAAK